MTTIIGVDCAVRADNVGCARAVLSKGVCTFVEVVACSTGRRPDQVLAEWLVEAGPRTLLALDAPLGWPDALGTMLNEHEAGHAPTADAHTLFRRAADDFVHATYGKRPLDVGADRIARTAHAALQLLETLRGRTRHALPLAWDAALEEPAAIEVYPAGTLIAHGLPWRGYKRDRAKRMELLASLRRRAQVPGALEEALLDSAHVLDAALCVLAGADFLAGAAVPPADERRARREGWIWVRRPSSADS